MTSTTTTIIFYLAFKKFRKLTWLQIFIEQKKISISPPQPHLNAAATSKLSADFSDVDQLIF